MKNYVISRIMTIGVIIGTLREKNRPKVKMETAMLLL